MSHSTWAGTASQMSTQCWLQCKQQALLAWKWKPSYPRYAWTQSYFPSAVIRCCLFLATLLLSATLSASASAGFLCVDDQEAFTHTRRPKFPLRPAVRVVSGNHVTGKRRGVVDGVDFGATGSGEGAP